MDRGLGRGLKMWVVEVDKRLRRWAGEVGRRLKEVLWCRVELAKLRSW